jgi:hypothetical protein
VSLAAKFLNATVDEFFIYFDFEYLYFNYYIVFFLYITFAYAIQFEVASNNETHPDLQEI